MNRSTPDAAVTIDPTHNTYATLGELHLDREQDLFCDVRVGCRRARGAPARAPATWNDGVDGALLCDLLFSLHDNRRRTELCRSWLCYVTGYTPASEAASSYVRGHCSTAVPAAPSRFCYFT
jgi:hypothetical protein